MARNNAVKWLLGGTVIAAAVTAITTLKLDDNLIYFYTPAEAVAKAAAIEGQNIKVGGMVKAGSRQWEPEKLALRFVMTDMDGHDIAVSHQGTPPDMFKEGQGVVVEGR